MNVYFDNAATTPIEKKVLDKMIPYMENGFGNPSSIHKRGREIKSAIEKSRSRVAEILSCEPGEIFFTSGGTEADNMFIANTVVEKKIDTIITSKIEHHAVLHCCEYLNKSKNVNMDPRQSHSDNVNTSGFKARAINNEPDFKFRIKNKNK